MGKVRRYCETAGEAQPPALDSTAVRWLGVPLHDRHLQLLGDG
jgi:hypothetical protein